METVSVFIETQLDTKTSFGVRVDNGESVFVNARLAKRHNIMEDETWDMVVLPNVGEDSANTPWKAITLSMKETLKAAEETPRVEVAKLEDRIMKYFDVEDNQVATTAPALAAALGEEDLQMQLTLTRMHNAGEMTKAQVHAKGGQEKASFVLWAPSTDWFAM
mgnify:CR=1 FL=1|tara:strand:- start:564 stop:1052 length:489 start_codon:yes stop_codon:yes gene_type:complete